MTKAPEADAAIRWLAALALCFLLGANAPAEKPDPIATVLDAAGVSAGELQPQPLALLSGRTALGRTPMLRAIQAEPLRAGYRAGTLEQRFAATLDSPHRLFLGTAAFTNAEISRGYLGNPLESIDRRLLAAEDPLAEALKMIGEASSDFDFASSLPDDNALPNPTRFEFARLIAVTSEAQLFLTRAFRKLPEGLDANQAIEQVLVNRYRAFDAPDYRIYINDIEMEALFAGMLDLMAAMEDFDDYVDHAGKIPDINWSILTPMGEIQLNTAKTDDNYQSSMPLLLIDLAGNDTYFSNGTSYPRKGISIVYDRKGNDTYFVEPGRGSAAVFGYGVLWDAEGDDAYNGDYLSQGAAIFGAAVQIDEKGKDVYKATAFSQGYATGGAALLVDLGGGDDSFTSILSSQASGGPSGAAVLINVGGDDTYLLANEPLLDPSPQDPGHNTSMGQGAATGIRADLGDGRSLAGGTALLIDTGGNDVYTAQVFCQGTGFLEGTGMLIDSGGDDKYSGVWYAQASAAHRAAGILIDRGHGDDVYTSSLYTSICCGHDLSTAFLLDEGGDDVYTVRNLGIGSGNDNGIAVFVDAGGNDTYTVEAGAAYGIGAAGIENWGTSREMWNGVGLFMDLGGKDTYNVKRDGPGNNTVWTFPRKYPELHLKSESGAGIDGIYDNPFPTRTLTESSGTDEKRLREAREARRKYRAKIK